jgi:hypothetical protein
VISQVEILGSLVDGDRKLAGLVFGADAVHGSLSAQFKSLLGDTGSKG